MPPGATRAQQLRVVHVPIGLVANRGDDQIILAAADLGDRKPVLAIDFIRRRERIRDVDLMPEPLQPPHQVEACGCCACPERSP